MLVVESNDASRIQRATATEIKEGLVRYYNKCRNHPEYLTGNNTQRPIWTSQMFEKFFTTGTAIETLSAWSTNPDNGQFSREMPNPQHRVRHQGIHQTMPASAASSDVRTGDPWEFSLVEKTYRPKRACVTDGNQDQQRKLTDGAINQAQKRLRLDTADALGDESRRFACPFFKNNPKKHWKTCTGPGWDQVRRVKSVCHSLPLIELN